jgi:hypothetical protein
MGDFGIGQPAAKAVGVAGWPARIEHVVLPGVLHDAAAPNVIACVGQHRVARHRLNPLGEEEVGGGLGRSANTEHEQEEAADEEAEIQDPKAASHYHVLIG